MMCCLNRSADDLTEDIPRERPESRVAGSNLQDTAAHATRGSRKSKALDRARLLVHVERAQGLLGMDVSGVNAKLALERTLDAYVTLRVNEEPEFGHTRVQWRTKGDPKWDENFATSVEHPKSYLCLAVWDDDPVFCQDTALAIVRQCGFLEVPLWTMPRNCAVTGWFTLNHPQLADNTSSLADRQAKLQPTSDPSVPSTAQDNSQSAGKVKLTLMLETTAKLELIGHMLPQPVFEASLPSLDLPQFLEDVFEAKRILLERIVMAAVRSIMYAISWEKPELSFAMVCWLWFLFFRPRFIWASVWCLVLLCFWHEIPQSREDAGQEGKQRGAHTNAQEQKRGGGVVDGFVETTAALGAGVVSGVSNIAHGAVGAITQVRGPDLHEYQQLLMFKPDLQNKIRGLQPIVASLRKSLEAADHLLYWKDRMVTTRAVQAVVGALVLSSVFRSYMGVLSWYGFLALFTVVLIAKASFFNVFVRFTLAVVATLARPNKPFQAYSWFELDTPCKSR